LLFTLLQKVQGQRTLVSLSKKLKLLNRSEKKQTAVVEELDASGRFSFWNQRGAEWNVDSVTMMGATILLVVVTTTTLWLRADGESVSVWPRQYRTDST
jgi:hypothetical protein